MACLDGTTCLTYTSWLTKQPTIEINLPFSPIIIMMIPIIIIIIIMIIIIIIIMIIIIIIMIIIIRITNVCNPRKIKTTCLI